MNENKTAIVISGMHRGGTSAVAFVVHTLGASLPAHLLPPQPDNPRGFFESPKIMQLNERILAASGTYWFDWRSINNAWSDNPHLASFLEEALQVLDEEYGSADFILLKDPRFSKIIPFWKMALEKFGFRVHHIIPVRHPDEVTASIFKRDAISKSMSRLVWARHFLDAECYSRDVPRSFVLWDDFLADWERAVVRIAEHLHIAWPRLTDQARADVEKFLTPDLRNHRASRDNGADDAPGNDYAGQSYSALKLLSQNPASKEAMKSLDSIRADYLKTERIYGPVFADMEIAGARVENEREQAKSRGSELDRQLAAAWVNGEATSAELARTKTLLGEMRVWVERTTRDRDALAVELGQKTAKADDLERQLGAAAQEIRAVESRLAEFRSLGAFGKIMRVLRHDDRHLKPVGSAAQKADGGFHFDGKLEDMAPPVATLDLSGLLRLHGMQFFVGAYGRLLRRLPDDSGLAHYMPRLLLGTPKIQFLAELAASREARDLHVYVPGLSFAVFKYRLSKLPVVGFIFRFITRSEGNSAVDRRLRAIEQALYTKIQ